MTVRSPVTFVTAPFLGGGLGLEEALKGIEALIPVTLVEGEPGPGRSERTGSSRQMC
jgi:hypothetical protein